MCGFSFSKMHMKQICVLFYVVVHTSIGYCSPSTVCSDPGPPSVPQWRWSWTALYVSPRFPPDTAGALTIFTWTEIEKHRWHNVVILHLRLLPVFCLCSYRSDRCSWRCCRKRPDSGWIWKASDARPVWFSSSLCWWETVCLFHNQLLLHSSARDLEETWRCDAVMRDGCVTSSVERLRCLTYLYNVHRSSLVSDNTNLNTSTQVYSSSFIAMSALKKNF